MKKTYFPTSEFNFLCASCKTDVISDDYVKFHNVTPTIVKLRIFIVYVLQ